MDSDAADRNRRVIERFIAEVVMEGRVDVLDELCDPGLINHAAAPQAREGIEGMKRVIGFSRAAMPDQRWTDQVVVADNEYVVVRAVRESTWSADSFRGIPTPQGATTAVEMVHIWRLADGKIVEHWAVRDDLGLMIQLGVVSAGRGS
jgi:predicted ester cyclase